MAHLIFKLTEHGSSEYRKAAILRRELLREPLGLSLTEEELSYETSQLHFVGMLGDQVVATILLACAGSECKMRQVAVDTKLQGQKIGSQFLSFIEYEAVLRGYFIIYCHARESAVNFYLRNGYEMSGNYFLEVGIPHIKMTKLLYL